MDGVTVADEGATLASAAACTQCLMDIGLAPETAPIVAVALALTGRILIAQLAPWLLRLTRAKDEDNGEP